ncbi:MAG: hypothetical protein JKY71_01845 [Alphaproteobacteria bacterium]|nr:hypothetical protein [Alphaproteobacteria bacterium]
MKKTHIFIGLAILGVAVHFIETYDANAPCFEIVEAGKPLHGDILLDKCKGRTWTMVQDDTTLSELGYVVEDGEDEEIKTVVWTRVSRGGGIVSLDRKAEK